MKNLLDKKIYEERDRKSRRDPHDPRGVFFQDQTKIVHSMPFRRLKKKTQVFFSPENDHICTRIEHVIHVATIAATICKGLKAENKKEWGFLNENMAYAIGLGHDLGHAPFGHAGESAIQEASGKEFHHEIQGYRVTQYVYELNLTYGVKDGIISHNGENFERKLKPKFEKKDLDTIKNRIGLMPSSYEGCIVRFADKIAYLGRDWEDAEKLNLINSDDVPKSIKDVLSYPKDKIFDGSFSNPSIINKIVLDLISNSKNSEYIELSEEVYNALCELKDFNYSKIYNHDKLKDYKKYVKKIIKDLYNHLDFLYTEKGRNYSAYDRDKILDRSFSNFIKERESIYQKESKEIIFIDYISGMTDDFALKCMEEISLPKPLNFEESDPKENKLEALKGNSIKSFLQNLFDKIRSWF